MTEIERYEILILGSREAGKYLAWTFARAGQGVALIQRGMIGGSCPNVACLPSKNIIHSARVASLFGRGAEFGIASGAIQVDMKGVRQRKRSMVDGLIAMHWERCLNSLVLPLACSASRTTRRWLSRLAHFESSAKMLEPP